MVVYKSKMMSSKSRGGKKNFKVFTADEFIAAITQHIPKISFQLVRYYGWYSNPCVVIILKKREPESS